MRRALRRLTTPLSWLLLLLAVAALACGNAEEFAPGADAGDEPAQVAAPGAEPATAEVVPAAAEAVSAAAAIGEYAFESAECPFASAAEVACGYLIVPENRTRADSPLIELAVAILPAPNGTPSGGTEAPIVFLEGGPGGSSLANFDASEWDFSFTRNRDLILIDQRGAGFSYPSLDCPELSDESYDFSQENPEVDCRDRLASEGVDLTAYNTTENAADIAALRAALGIAEWNLLGVSYGTRLALDVMRFHPQGIRSVILDSPFPPNADTPVDEVLLTYERMAALFATCAEDAYCAGEYPDLEQVFLDTIAALNERPVADLTGDVFSQHIISAMQDTALIPLIPYVIYEVNAGNVDALDEFAPESFSRRVRFQVGEGDDDSEGMYNSVMCRDEFSFGDYDRTEEAVEGLVPEEVAAGLLQTIFETFQMCDFWGAGAADLVQGEAVAGDLPTLLLVGEFDTATPLQWAFLAAQTLPNSFVFVFPGAGHSLLTTTECSEELVAAFLDDPGVEPDGSCLEGIEWPYFD